MFNRNSENFLHAVRPDQLDKPESVQQKQPVRVEFNRANTHLLGLLLFTISILLLIWAWFTELNEIVEAQGQLEPDEQVQPIRAAFDSKVKSVRVHAGARVKKGEILLTLDAKTYRAELDKDQHELKIAEQELDNHQKAYNILTAYLQDVRTLPPDLSSVLPVAKAIGDVYAARQQLDRALHDTNRDANSARGSLVPEFGALQTQHQSISEQKSLKERALIERGKQFKLEEQKAIDKIAGIQAQIELQNTEVTQKQLSLDGTKKQLEAYERVFRTGGSSKTECLDAKMRVEDRQKDLTMTQARLIELEGQLETAKHELDELQSRNSMQIAQMQGGLGEISASSAQVTTRMRSQQKLLSQAQTHYRVALQAAGSTRVNETNEITNLKKQIEQLTASSRAEAHIFEKGEVRSPVDGTVALFNLQGPGEVVQREQHLLTIVPSKENLIACLHVPNEDVPFIHDHDVVKLQFPAYPYQQYGTISARITTIDIFPSMEKEYANTYRVVLKPMQDWIVCRSRKISLRKGLQVQAQLVLRKRRLLITILAPLLKAQYSHFKA